MRSWQTLIPLVSAVPLSGHNPILGQKILHIVEGAISIGIRFEGALYHGRNGGINDDSLCSFVVHIWHNLFCLVAHLKIRFGRNF